MHAMEVIDFRPISLVDSMYKIISNVLANRLSIVMDRIPSKSQNAFVRGRKILGLILIANECLDSRIKLGVLGILCKFDMEMAYDHVNWEFLFYLLRICDFEERWRSWMRHCVSMV